MIDKRKIDNTNSNVKLSQLINHIDDVFPNDFKATLPYSYVITRTAGIVYLSMN